MLCEFVGLVTNVVSYPNIVFASANQSVQHIVTQRTVRALKCGEMFNECFAFVSIIIGVDNGVECVVILVFIVSVHPDFQGNLTFGHIGSVDGNVKCLHLFGENLTFYANVVNFAIAHTVVHGRNICFLFAIVVNSDGSAKIIAYTCIRSTKGTFFNS